MPFQFEFRPYARRFRQPLRSRHGLWQERRGILVRLVDEAGRGGWGEIAPLEWFGTESLEVALDWCRQQPAVLEEAQVWTVPEELPACQFGLESAWERVGAAVDLPGPVTTNAANHAQTYSALLPTGPAAVQAWRSLHDTGNRTFKWKIGVAPFLEEAGGFTQLMAQLPPDSQLRLDANAGLDWDTACRWLELCDRHPQVEFLEQPLPPDQLEAMQHLQTHFRTAIALDESVAQLPDLEACYDRGWRGILVVKAAIAGSPRRLRQFCQRPGVDVVWSSVFETAIARTYIETCLVATLPPNHRALGFGIDHWFEDADFAIDRFWPPLTPETSPQ